MAGATHRGFPPERKEKPKRWCLSPAAALPRRRWLRDQLRSRLQREMERIMINPHFLSRTSPPDQPFDLETIEAMSAAYQAACRKLDPADRDDVAQHVIELAQTGVRNPTQLYRLTVKEFKNKVR